MTYEEAQKLICFSTFSTLSSGMLTSSFEWAAVHFVGDLAYKFVNLLFFFK